MNVRFCKSFNTGVSKVGECHLWVHLYWCRSIHYVLLDLPERWELRSRTTSVLWGATSGIFSRQYTTPLWSSHLAFPPSVTFLSPRSAESNIDMVTALKNSLQVTIAVGTYHTRPLLVSKNPLVFDFYMEADLPACIDFRLSDTPSAFVASSKAKEWLTK